MDSHILVLILTIVGSTLSETIIIVTAQPDQLIGNNSIPIPSPPNITDSELGSDDKRIILTWLKTNETDVTQLDVTPAFIVDKRDFLNIFGQFFENSNNNNNHTKTINAIE